MYYSLVSLIHTVSWIFLLGAHYLSAKLVHYLSGFMLRDLGVHNEAGQDFFR